MGDANGEVRGVPELSPRVPAQQCSFETGIGVGLARQAAALQGFGVT